MARYLPLRTRASLRRSAVNAMPAPMTMRASVALRLPGATQLTPVMMMAGASYIALPSLRNPILQNARDPLESIHYLSRAVIAGN
jgi:hypothetical protein